MNYRHITFAAALICTSPDRADRRRPASRAPSSNCSPARAVRPVRPPTSCSASWRSDPSLLTMSLAVDYWDYLGWKDTLALHGHTNRQRAYADARGDREVYTPQVVVNGVVHVLGSDKAAIEKAIAQTRSTAAPLTLPVTIDRRGWKSDGERAGRQGRAPQRRSLALPDHRQGAGRDRARREPRPHADLPQRGAPLGEARRLERQGGKPSACRWPIFPMAIIRSRTSTSSR